MLTHTTFSSSTQSSTHLKSEPCSFSQRSNVRSPPIIIIRLVARGRAGQPGPTAQRHTAHGSKQPPSSQARTMQQAAPAAGSGLIQLKLDGTSISSTEGLVLLQQLGEGITVSHLSGQQDQHHTKQNSSSDSNSSLQLPSAAHSTAVPQGALLLDLASSRAAAPHAVMNLGRVCGTAFLACSRIKLCWMAPYHSSSIAALPGHVQFLLVQVADGGPYAVIVPLLPNACKATLQPASPQDSSGNLLAVHLDSGNPDVKLDSWQRAVLVAAGWDPYSLVDTAVAAAAAIAGGARPRWEKQVPDIARYLGWCTWDAFYHDVSAQGIVSGLESFKAAGSRPRWLIIDDGWQRTGLDRTAQQQLQQQQDQQQLKLQQQQPQAKAQQGLRSHPLPDSATAGENSSDGSSSSSSGLLRGSWLLRQLSRAVARAQRALLTGVSAIADRLNWWSVLLAGLRCRLLSGMLVRLLKAFNVATSEHSKRLLSNEFNAKFSNLSIGPTGDTSSTATAAEVAAVIAAIKQRYGLKHVYAWHAILGYWSGVSPAAVAAAPAVAAASAATATDTVAVAAAAAPGDSKLDVASEVAAAAVAAAEATVLAGETAVAAVGAAGAGSAPGIVTSSGNSADITASSSGSSGSAMGSSIVLPRVSAAMSDLEPPCNWSQLVLAGMGLPSNPHAFLTQLHSYLAALGITGVKVDVQNQLELAGSALGQAGGQALAAAWHAALEDSAARHFPGNQLINCMCHNTNNLYRMRDTCIARVSDDFYPKLPASHTTHVAVCAFNSLFMGVVVQPDWDMFHSAHPRALLHGTARMISAGPVYVSDRPGRHDAALLSRLALPGSGLLLQPLLPGRPTRDCLFKDPCSDGASVLKVWNRNSCGGVVAAFNLQGSGWSRQRLKFVIHDPSPPALSAHVTPGDLEGLGNCLPPGCVSSSSSSSNADDQAAAAAAALQDEKETAAAAGVGVGTSSASCFSHTGRYVMYRDSSQSMCVVQDSSTGLAFELQPAGSDVITVAPLLELGLNSSSSISFAAIGMMNMLNPGGAVKGIAVGGSRGSNSAAAAGDARRDSSSSTGSIGSWVVAGDDVPTPDCAVTAAAEEEEDHGGGSACDEQQAGEQGAAGAPNAATTGTYVRVAVVGFGQLLLYCSCEPSSVVLDGQAVGFKFDSSTCSVVVDVPASGGMAAEARDLQHEVVVGFQ